MKPSTNTHVTCSPRENTEFGSLIAPLMAPMFVIQMARHKRWSSAARTRAVKRFRTACREAEEAATRFLEREQDDTERST